MATTDFTARCMAGKALDEVAGKQDVIADLDTIRAGAEAGATAVQPATLENYQPKIDSTHKLDADLVDDTNSTNKFATQSELDQIELNKNNISSIISLFAGCQFFADMVDKKNYSFTVKRRNGNARYRYGLFITGNTTVMPTLYSIFADTNNSVTITKLAGDSTKPFTGTLSYDSSGVGTLGISVGDNVNAYGGLRGIWFD